MDKVLVIVDMQKDFIDGALTNPDAQKIVDKIAEFAENWEGRIIFTRDTHTSEYMNTQEGKYLPVPHCIKGTEGWQINDKILSAANSNAKCKISFVDKPYFGAGTLLAEEIKRGGETEKITFCGTCTDICVVSNVLILKSLFGETPVEVKSDLCAGLTKEKHEAALEVMRSCQVNVN